MILTINLLFSLSGNSHLLFIFIIIHIFIGGVCNQLERDKRRMEANEALEVISMPPRSAGRTAQRQKKTETLSYVNSTRVNSINRHVPLLHRNKKSNRKMKKITSNDYGKS